MKDNTKNTLKYYWQFSLNHKISGLIIIASITVAAVLNVIVPLYFKDFFNVLVGAGTKVAIARNLISILLVIALLEFIQWLFWRFATFADSYFTAKTTADIANYCFAYLHKHSFEYFNSNFVGSLVKRVKWFVRAFEVIIDRTSWSLLPLAINILIIAFVLFQVNFWLGLGVTSWTIIFLVINWFFTKYKLKYDIARSEAETATTRVLADTVTNNSNVKLFNGYKRELRSFAQVIDDWRQTRMTTWTLGNIIEAVQGFLMTGLEIGIFYLAIRLWQKDILTVGDFVLIQAYLVNIFMRTWEFGRVIRSIYENLADAEEMTVILTTPHEITDIPDAKKLKVTDKKIEFQNVTFNYHRTRSALKNFNLTINPGERLALIGPSGAGKTTIIRLLLRMYDVTSGRILIDGQDITKVTQESLWQNISLVPQDPILFHRPLMENIRYGNPKATDKEVITAAKLSHCHEFIIKSPDGYDTYVGERGIKLSSGERQRVAIARAILRNAPILVLDEATSSLDSESEFFIQDALDKLIKGKTVIVIAHRLSTIRKMDRIVVIDNKGIVEDGSHQQLISLSKGMYRRLWELQAGGFI